MWTEFNDICIACFPSRWQKHTYQITRKLYSHPQKGTQPRNQDTDFPVLSQAGTVSYILLDDGNLDDGLNSSLTAPPGGH